MHAEDEEIEMDPEYAPKRALTTKVRQQLCQCPPLTLQMYRYSLLYCTEHFATGKALAERTGQVMAA